MITYVKLKNFKSFKNTMFDFRKGKKSYKKFIAVYGENGSGKSNFVDSLSFLRLSLESFHMVALQQMQKAGSLPDALRSSLANGDLLSFQKMMADHRMIACDEPTTIELGFVFNNHSGYYSVSFKEGFVGEKLYYFTGKQSGVVFDLSLQDGGIVKSFCGSFFQTKESERELATLIDQYWGKHSLLSILNNERESKNKDYINKSYMPYVFEVINMILLLTAKHSIGSLKSQNANVNYQGVIENPLEGLIAVSHENALNQTERILNTFFAQAYSDIKQVFYKKNPEGPNLHYRLYVDKMIGGQIRSINFQEESEGTKRILFMINDLLGACQGGTIALDEIDTGIHDLLLRTMLSSIDEWINGQLIITTHNTYLLETLRPQSIYVINVDYLGNKEVHCLDEYDIHGTNNIRSMYIKGLFGGVPVVDEIEYGEVTNVVTVDTTKAEPGTEIAAVDHLYKIEDGTKTEVASHNTDHTVESQKLFVPEMKTEASDSKTKDHVGTAEVEASISDILKYKNLADQKIYLVTAKLRDAETGEEVADPVTRLLRINYKDTEVTQKMLYWQGPKDGTLLMPAFTFDASAMEGKTLVVTETLTDMDSREIILTHEALDDTNQQIHYIKVRTEAKDGITNTHVGTVTDKATVIDQVTIENAVIGETYVITGSLVYQEDCTDADGVFHKAGEVIAEHEPVEVTAEKTTIVKDLAFTLDASKLEGISGILKKQTN